MQKAVDLKKMTDKEKVLCIKRNLLPEKWTETKTIIKLKENIFFDICSKAGFQWIKRDTAENDPSFKQIIPYIILQTDKGKKTAIYKRKGTEKRLHDLWSLGIGGHINTSDTHNNHDGIKKSDLFKKILIAGMKREFDEELAKRPKNQIPVFTGIINEEISEVGSVHMGAVFRLITDTPAQFLPGDELHCFQWKETALLKSRNMELWSHLALELIS